MLQHLVGSAPWSTQLMLLFMLIADFTFYTCAYEFTMSNDNPMLWFTLYVILAGNIAVLEIACYAYLTYYI